MLLLLLLLWDPAPLTDSEWLVGGEQGVTRVASSGPTRSERSVRSLASTSVTS